MAYTFGDTVLDDGVNYFLIEKPYNMVPYTQVLQKIARLEGMKKSGESVDARTIVCKVKVVGSSRIDLENKLSDLHAGLALLQQPLQIYAQDGRYYIADANVTDEILISGQPISVVVQITFTCRQPYAFAESASNFDTGIITLTGSGTTWNAPIQNITGNGTIYAPPTIRVYQRITNLTWTSIQLAQLLDARTLKITTGMPTTSSDYVDFFCDTSQAGVGYTIQKNDNGTLLDFTGQFPVIEPFAHPWLITITAPSAPQAQVVWTWTPRYLP